MKISTVTQLLKKLIDIPSVTGNEAAIGNFLSDYLADQNFQVTRIPVDGSRFNVLAQTGQPRIMLQAHMDVVPPHLAATEDDTYIYGRGACDTKGSIACMIMAAQQAQSQGLTDFGLLFTVDEEVGFAGAKKAQSLVKKLGAFLVVGEPTKLQPITGHYGISVFSLVCTGKAAHSSEPQLGKNAIDQLVSLLHGPIKNLRLNAKTLMSVVRISGGVADNVIPDKAEALLSFRVAPGDQTDYAQKVQDLVGDQAQVDKVQNLAPVASKLPPALSFLGAEGQVKYCTELSFFKTGVVFGPGDIADAHTPNEKVKKSDLQLAVETYERILSSYK
jgi:acetylornithine deacetylase